MQDWTSIALASLQRIGCGLDVLVSALSHMRAEQPCAEGRAASVAKLHGAVDYAPAEICGLCGALRLARVCLDGRLAARSPWRRHSFHCSDSGQSLSRRLDYTTPPWILASLRTTGFSYLSITPTTRPTRASVRLLWRTAITDYSTPPPTSFIKRR